MTLVFATHNENKLREVRQILGNDFKISGLEDINCTEEIPETQDTIEGNALQKARYLYDKYGVNCFADDTGLEVEILNGAPGVFSARYAGPEKSSDANIDKLLSELSGKGNRSARFKTVFALIIDGREYRFEGIVQGRIAETRAGTAGFGYDPVFVPNGYEKSFAEMNPEQKNRIGHRGQATQKLITFLKTLSA